MDGTNNRHDSGAARGPRWHRRKESRPAEILASAIQEFVEKGYAATRLEDVARRAGVTKGTMYLYFENKEALFKEMVRHYVVPGIERAEQVAREYEGSPRELVVLLLRHWWERLIEQPHIGGLAKLVMAEASNFPDVAAFYYREVFERNLAILSDAIARGMERGEFREVDARKSAALGLMPLVMLAQWKHSFMRVASNPVDLPAYFEAHLAQFLRGLETPAETADRA
ncbi:MAG: TetR/AcrR family transcriptional regulator [Candidatus Eisenbacteria bacterium]